MRGDYVDAGLATLAAVLVNPLWVHISHSPESIGEMRVKPGGDIGIGVLAVNGRVAISLKGVSWKEKGEREDEREEEERRRRSSRRSRRKDNGGERKIDRRIEED